MTTCATWFGPPERSLFGIVHVPLDGEIRGGVALCPPLGYEYVCSHRTLRTVAEALASVGLMALRFDYDGTGDSVGDSHDPGRVEAWSASVGHALEFLRSAGAPALGVIGMRIGATLASAVVDDCRASVLWDPVLSGRAFLREQRALHKVALTGAAALLEETAVVELVGTEYTAETVAALERLEIPTRHVSRSLALLRADRPTQRIEKRLAGWSDVSIGEALGQDRLLDVESSTALVPHQTIETIVTWLSDTMPRQVVPVDLSRSHAVARFSVDEEQLTEQLVELGRGSSSAS